MKDRILIIGALGQVGTDLRIQLAETLGESAVLSTDIKNPNNDIGPFKILNVLDSNQIKEIFSAFKPTQVYHLAAMLSATAEKFPKKGWDLNMNGLFNIFDACLEYKVSRIFWPSSIAVFGPTTPKKNTPQNCIMDPNTIYGISKLAGERYCEYYFQKYDLDVRSIRYPGIISWKALPGGGTTDYAVEIFHEALKVKNYECFLKQDTELPMIYINDAIKATIDITNAPSQSIKTRNSYNLSGFSVTPELLGLEIKNHISDFNITYEPDHRQAIADSWPQSIDDSDARKDWKWQHQFDLPEMTLDMITNLKTIL